MEQVSTKVAEYSVTEAALADLAQRFKGATFDVTTKDGLKAARVGRAELTALRVSLEKKRQELKAPLLVQGRLIDDEAKRITGELVALEDPIDAQIKAHERVEEARRQAAAIAEAQRRALIMQRITNIERVPTSCLGAKAAAIALVLEAHRRDEPEDWAQEYLPQAKQAHLTTLQQLEKMHTGSLVAEAEAQRQAEERARLAAEQKRIDEERAKLDAEKRAQQEKAEAEERAARERREADDRDAAAARAEADRQAKAVREAEDARLKAEADRLDAERRRLEEDARAEQFRKDEEARAVRLEEQRKREAEENARANERREAERKAHELMDARQMLVAFREKFGHLQQFETVVAEIDACLAVPA